MRKDEAIALLRYGDALSEEYWEAVEIAIDALEAQKPRVLGLDEVKELQNRNYVYYELKDKSGAYAKRCNESNTVKAVLFAISTNEYVGSEGAWYYFMVFEDIWRLRCPEVFSGREGLYGIDWRCWNEQPTETQRKAVKWDG